MMASHICAIDQIAILSSAPVVWSIAVLWYNHMIYIYYLHVISPAAVSNTICAVQCVERSQMIAVSEYLKWSKCTWSSFRIDWIATF